MSKIKIDVEVQKDRVTLRSFNGLTVNLWDTYAENLREYGEEMLQGCFVGTSGKVNIQNQIRAFAAKRTDAGEFENDDASVVKFATALRVTVGRSSELQQEVEKQIAAMPDKEREEAEKDLAELKRLQAKHAGMQKTGRESIAKRNAQ